MTCPGVARGNVNFLIKMPQMLRENWQTKDVLDRKLFIHAIINHLTLGRKNQILN